MSKAEQQDHQWLMCVTAAMSIDDMDIYFEDIPAAKTAENAEKDAPQPVAVHG